MTKTFTTISNIRLARFRAIFTITVSVLGTVLCSAISSAADLSRYHQFQIGSDLATVVRLTQVDASQVKVLHQRPALIQELEWRPDRSEPPVGFESVRVILFSFSDGQLFRMFVDYDRYKTEGLSADDLIASISTIYGTATRPSARIGTGTQSDYAYSTSEQVLARWENPEYSLNLIASDQQPIFGLIITSRRSDLLAQKAIIEGERLDVLAAPQRERDRVAKEAADERTKQEKAKLVNRPAFKP